MSDVTEPPASDSDFVKLFEATISEDPTAFMREDEIIYQVTRNELLALEKKLNSPRQALLKLIEHVEAFGIGNLTTAIEEARKSLT